MHNILQPKKLCDGGKPGLRGTGSVKVKPPDIPSPPLACVAGGCELWHADVEKECEAHTCPVGKGDPLAFPRASG